MNIHEAKKDLEKKLIEVISQFEETYKGCVVSNIEPKRNYFCGTGSTLHHVRVEITVL